jgi:hypothetical protein
LNNEDASIILIYSCSVLKRIGANMRELYQLSES